MCDDQTVYTLLFYCPICDLYLCSKCERNTSNHIHPIEIIRRYKHYWFCDHCEKTFNTDIPSYHCTLCDFDLCINCAKNFVKEGNVKEIEE